MFLFICCYYLTNTMQKCTIIHMDNVILSRIDSYDSELLSDKFSEIFESLNLFHILKPKMRVLILPTLSGPSAPDAARTTHPSLICALVNVLSKNGIKCIVAASPYGKYDVQTLDKTYLETGMIDAENVSKFELNHDLTITKKNYENGVRAKSVTLLGIINDVDAIINVNKLIYDSKLGYLGAANNLMYLIPGELKTVAINRLTTLKDYYDYLLDLFGLLEDKIKLNITDGIVTLEQGVQRMASFVGVSKNPIALDAAVLDVLGVNPHESIVKVATDRGIVDITRPYRSMGDKVEDLIIGDYNIGDFALSSDITDAVKHSKLYFKSHQQRTTISRDKCKGCMVCTKICPTGAISMKLDKNNERYAEIDYTKCIFCNKCYTACPYSVIDVKTPLKYKLINKEIDKFNN